MADFSLGGFVYAGHYALLHHILTVYRPQGYALEFGVGSGESARLIAEYMPVIGFGSEEGLPEDWRPEFPKGAFAFPLPEIDNAAIYEGWFDDVLPTFDFEALGPVGLIHMDADLYSSTATALKYAGPCIQPGTVLVFDEWHSYDGCEDHEQRAWREYAAKTGVSWTVLGHSHQAWAIRIDGERVA